MCRWPGHAGRSGGARIRALARCAARGGAGSSGAGCSRLVSRPRFIAGAICPSCGQIDRLQVLEVEGEQLRRCVACGHEDDLSTTASQATGSSSRTLPTPRWRPEETGPGCNEPGAYSGPEFVGQASRINPLPATAGDFRPQPERSVFDRRQRRVKKFCLTS